MYDIHKGWRGVLIAHSIFATHVCVFDGMLIYIYIYTFMTRRCACFVVYMYIYTCITYPTTGAES